MCFQAIDTRRTYRFHGTRREKNSARTWQGLQRRPIPPDEQKLQPLLRLFDPGKHRLRTNISSLMVQYFFYGLLGQANFAIHII